MNTKRKEAKKLQGQRKRSNDVQRITKNKCQMYSHLCLLSVINRMIISTDIMFDYT